jgi:hypothetical protein
LDVLFFLFKKERKNGERLGDFSKRKFFTID